MGAISDFVADFSRDHDKYLTIEEEVKALCEKALEGIDFLWQSRVKATESLETKLRGRMSNYKDESENVADVKDLVAGRIILARWLDFGHVEKVVGQIFNVRGRAQHPKNEQNTVNPKARFRGYDGLHFHVTRREPSKQQPCKPVIEIQVMSAFMWGFSTLEHDIEYKKLHGEPNEDLLLSLEMLKGISNTGEIALQMYDRSFFPVAKFSSQQHDFNTDLQNSLRNVVAEVGLDEDDKKCLRDLGSGLTDPRDDRKRIERHKGGLQGDLCSWVLEDPAFVDWCTHDDFRFLWIHGDPGKGKTMIMMAIIDELSERLRDRPGSNVLAYFFCENTNSKLNTTVSVLRGLIFQLVDQEKKLISHLRKRYDSKGAKVFEDENALDVLLELLSNILKDQRLGNVYFMVDALDECDAEIHELLQRIIDESFEASPKIKWLTTSRNELAFIEQLGRRHQRHTSLELNSLHVTRAVADFIEYKVKELANEKFYASELQDFVRKSLLRKSEGTFLWVALVCKELKKVRKKHAKSLIEEIPAGLKPLYARMMNKILSQDRQIDIELCRQILCSVTLAFRPLRLEEIVVFAKIPEEFHKDPLDLRDLVSLCGSFLTIREETVYLVHQSAKDFLSDGERKDIFHLGQENEHASTASLCLEVMSSSLRKDICSLKMPDIHLGDIDESTIIAHLPFHVQYACLYWVDHLQQGSATELETFVWPESCQVYGFLQHHFLHWLEALSLMDRFAEAALALSSLREIRSPMNAKLSSFVSSASEFLQRSRHIIRAVPLQIYNSALVFSPETSTIKRLFTHDWPVWIKKLSIHDENPVSKINATVFSPDGQLLAVICWHAITLWDLITGASLHTLDGQDPEYFFGVNFAPDGQLLASISYNKITLWDPFTGESLRTLKGHSKGVTRVVFSPNGQLLASASDDDTVRLWNPFTGESLRTLEGHSMEVTAVIFAPDGQLLASASNDKIIRLWNPFTGESLRMLKGHSEGVTAVIFAPHGQLLASASNDKTIRLWNPFTGESLRMLKGHSEGVTTVVFSPESQLLASASDDKTVRLWESETGQEIEQIKGYYGNDIFFSKDGSQLEWTLGLIPSEFSSNILHSPVSILSVKNKWVLYKGFKALWLPIDLFAYAIRDNFLVLEDRSGRITFLRFSKTLTPFQS